MKKKILLVLAMVAVFTCLMAISISAAQLNEYGTVEVTLSDNAVKTVYFKSERWESRVILNNLYLMPDDESEQVDLSTVIKLDFTNSKAYYNGKTTPVEQTVRHMYSSGNGYVNVTEVILPSTITHIRERSFSGWTSLKSITIPSSVTAVQNQAFLNCTALESVYFEDGIALGSISDSFQGCTALKSIEIPASVKALNQTFYGCTALETVTFAQGSALETLNNTFRECKSLCNIELPSSIKKIDNNTFWGCTALTSINLPEGLLVIGSSSFRSTGLVTVTIPSSLTTLGKAAFYTCASLTHVYNLENTSVTWMGETFLKCTALEYVRLPKGLVTLESGGDGTFYQCTSLSDVGPMPKTLEYIGKNSFASSGLSGVLDFSECTSLKTFQGNTFARTKITKVILSPSITDLGDHTFVWCQELEEIVGLEFVNVAELKGNLIEGKTKVTELKLPISASDGLLEVGNLLWDRTTPITVYVANKNVKLDGIFAKTSSKINIVYCGNDYEAFFENSPTTKTNVGENVFAAGTEVDQTKHMLTYGNNLCEVFYGGKHNVPSIDMNFVDYLTAITFEGVCGQCNDAVVDESRTIGALFTYHGYSCTEKAINGKYSVAQFFGVNNENVAKYEELTGKTVNFGIVATGNADGTAIKPLEKGDKVITQQFSNYPFGENSVNYFAVKVNGIASEYVETNFIFCAYVSVDGEVVYIDNNAQVTELAGISHSQLDSILN